MRFIKPLVLLIVLAVVSALPAAAQTFPAQGEYYHDLDGGHFTTCPGGFMVGIGARTGDWFNAIYALCATYDSASRQLVPSAPGLIFGFYASAAGNLQEKRCPQNQAIEYIAFSEFETKEIQLGVPGDPFTMLDEIVFRCRGIITQAESVNDPVIGMTSNDPLEIAGMNTKQPYPSGPNVNAGFTHRERCVDGRLATGLAVAAPGSFDQAPKYFLDGVNGIGLQCGVQPLAPPPFGGGGAPPPPPKPTQPIDISGGGSYPLGPQGGGKQIDVYCATGQVMVGLYGSGKAGYLSNLYAQCAQFAGRTWSGLPIDVSSGGLGTGLFSSGTMDKCTPPNAVTSVEGDVTSLGGIARLRVRCGSEITAYMGRNSPSSLETWTHGVITCGPNNVARGIYGWLNGDGTVKSFGLHCLPANAFSGGPSGIGFGGSSGGGMGGGGSGGGGSGGGGGGGGGSSGGGLASLSDFAGTWHVTVNNGYSYTMTLFVSGGTISGNYDTGRANGQVSNGHMSGTNLTMTLSQSAVVVGSGTGTFHFVDPLELSGAWSIGPYSGTWTATH